MLRRLALLFFAAATLWAQNNPQVPESLTTLKLNVPLLAPPVQTASGSAQVVGNPGPQTYYYWVVTQFTVGASSPAGPFLASQVPNTLSGSNYVKVFWQAVPGASTYDLLRTTTPAAPSGACACAVATGLTSPSGNDQSNTLSAYSVAPLDVNTLALSLTNEAVAAAQSHLYLRQNGTLVADLSNAGAAAAAVKYVSTYAGADWGAKVAACLADTSSSICDARGASLQGAQAITSTINVTSRSVLIVDCSTVTSSVTPMFKVSADFQIAGTDRTCSKLIGSAGGVIFAGYGTVRIFGVSRMDLSCGSGSNTEVLIAPDYQSAIAPASFSGLVRSANVVTVTTVEQHQFLVGDTVTISGADDASFDGVFPVTSKTLTTFTYAQVAANATSGAGTARGSNDWSAGTHYITQNSIHGCSSYAVWLGQSVYFTTLEGNLFYDNNGDLNDEWAADMIVGANNIFYYTAGAPAAITNPHLRTKSGSHVVIRDSDFERDNANTTQPDVLLEASSYSGTAGWVKILDNKFGPEGETATRPKIQVKSTGTYSNPGLVFINTQIDHNDMSSAGAGSYAIDIQNPVAKFSITGNYFAGYNTVVHDSFTITANEYEGHNLFDCSNRVANILSSLSANNTVTLFTNGGRGFTTTCDPAFTADTGTPADPFPSALETPELRNRVAESQDLSDATNWQISQITTNIVSISRAANVVTVQTAAASLATTGFKVQISGVTDASFDGIFTVASTPDGTHFTYAQAAADASSSGGTSNTFTNKVTCGQTDPLGGTTACQVQRAGLSASEPIEATIDTTAQLSHMYLSFWAKAGSFSQMEIGIWDPATKEFQGVAPIVSLGSGWKRYEVPFAGMDSSHPMVVLAYGSTGFTAVAGTYYLWGVQVADYPKQTYLHTSGTALTDSLGGAIFNRRIYMEFSDLANYVDMAKISLSGNPVAGKLRLYADISTGLIACRDSSGAGCMPVLSTGAFILPAASTSVTVSDAKVTASSHILLTRDDSLGTVLSTTCNTQSSLVLGEPRVTSRSVGISFTVTLDVAPTTNGMCIGYTITK